MWAVGVSIFPVLCGGGNPWRCHMGWETLVEIAGFVGIRATVDLAKRFGIALREDVFHDISHVTKSDLKIALQIDENVAE
jgi:hypothetical protein